MEDSCPFHIKADIVKGESAERSIESSIFHNSIKPGSIIRRCFEDRGCGADNAFDGVNG